MAAQQVICDTDVLIDYLDSKQKRHTQTKEVIDQIIGLDNVVISGITQMELLAGALNKQDLSKIKKSTGRFTMILLNQQINIRATGLLETYALSHGLSIPDSLIAATAIEAKLQLYSYNHRDYKFISGLTLYRYQNDKEETP